MGVSQVVVGLGGIVYPIVIELMMEEYGFRGKILQQESLIKLKQMTLEIKIIKKK